MDSIIQGDWLRLALRAQGVSIYATAKQLGVRPDKFYAHISNKAHLSAESLAELARLFPSLNVRFVLTGQGSPLQQ